MCALNPQPDSLSGGNRKVPAPPAATRQVDQPAVAETAKPATQTASVAVNPAGAHTDGFGRPILWGCPHGDCE